MGNQIEVRTGQIWADNNPREKDRQMKVVYLGIYTAVMANMKTGKYSTISLDRFRPGKRGYQLVKDVED